MVSLRAAALINFLGVCGNFSLLVCYIIKLEHRIKYEYLKAVNTTKQSFRSTWWHKNIDLLDIFYFKSVSLLIIHYKYIYIQYIFLSYLNSIVFSVLHEKTFETIFEQLDESITLLHDPLISAIVKIIGNIKSIFFFLMFFFLTKQRLFPFFLV